jgi:hypothetical protein
MLTSLSYIISQSVSAATLFIDDFEDGSATDGSPVTWSPHPNPSFRGQHQVENGQYVITRGENSQAGVATVDGFLASDVSIRALVRKTGTRGELGLLARGSVLGSETAYQGGIHTDGRVYLGWNDPAFHYLGEVATDLRVLGEDVFLQLDAFGNTLSFYAWRATEIKPEVPRLTAVDSRYTTGLVGLLHFPQSQGDSSRIQFVQVADAPIPASLAGDYDSNGSVDAADYVVWRNGLGTTYSQNDYNVWRANFGLTAAAAGASSYASLPSMPEPTALLVLITGILSIAVGCRRLLLNIAPPS